MIDRGLVIAAVRDELDARAEGCRPEHVAIGAAVADRLGLEHDTRPDLPRVVERAIVPPLDRLGTGAFVRRVQDWPLEVVRRFGWVCVAVINSNRAAMNRDRAWFEAVRSAGVAITVMDWLPAPANWGKGLASAVAFAREVGALAYVIDGELEWKGKHAVAAAAFVAEVARLGAEVRPGFTSYSLPTSHPTLPWRAFLEHAALAIPQPYDRFLNAAPGYAERACEEYRARGAVRIACGRGAHRADDPATPQVEAWRTPDQLRAHRALTPPAGIVGTAWWFPAGRPSAERVDAIVG